MVFNSCGWARTGVARTGRVDFREHRGRILLSETPGDGKFLPRSLRPKETAREICFRRMWHSGLRTFLAWDATPIQSACFLPRRRLQTPICGRDRTPGTREHAPEAQLDPGHGALISLIDKASGQELLDARKSPFPAFKGAPQSCVSRQHGAEVPRERTKACPEVFPTLPSPRPPSSGLTRPAARMVKCYPHLADDEV